VVRQSEARSERLLDEIDHVALVRGALAVAQVERTLDLRQRDTRKRKLIGHARHQLMPIVGSFGPCGKRLAGMLAEALPPTEAPVGSAK